jgi:hypothetical protein
MELCPREWIRNDHGFHGTAKTNARAGRRRASFRLIGARAGYGRFGEPAPAARPPRELHAPSAWWRIAGMARCEQGYLCEVCGDEVAEITDSDLYLRFVIGEIDARSLLSSPERHIRCNPTLAQFIVDEGFAPVNVDGPFSKTEIDSAEVGKREQLVTRGWRRLQDVRQLGIAISDYPLPEVRRT